MESNNNCPPPQECGDTPDVREADAYSSEADAKEGEIHRNIRLQKEAVQKKEIDDDVMFAAQELGLKKEDLLLSVKMLLPVLKKEWNKPDLTVESALKSSDYVGTCMDFLLDAMPMGNRLDITNLKTLCDFANYAVVTEDMNIDDFARFVSLYISIGVLHEAYIFSLTNNIPELESRYNTIHNNFQKFGITLFENVNAVNFRGEKNMAMTLCMKDYLQSNWYFDGVKCDDKNKTVVFIFYGSQFSDKSGMTITPRDEVTVVVDAGAFDAVRAKIDAEKSASIGQGDTQDNADKPFDPVRFKLLFDKYIDKIQETASRVLGVIYEDDVLLAYDPSLRLAHFCKLARAGGDEMSSADLVEYQEVFDQMLKDEGIDRMLHDYDDAIYEGDFYKARKIGDQMNNFLDKAYEHLHDEVQTSEHSDYEEGESNGHAVNNVHGDNENPHHTVNHGDTNPHEDESNNESLKNVMNSSDNQEELEEDTDELLNNLKKEVE